MNTITRHIEYLILHHDCVIVPGLGAFIAQHFPARIDETSGVIFPPSRILSFNEEISHNDGLLAASVARACSMTFDAALASIECQVATLKSQIEEIGEFAVGRLGSFEMNAEGKLIFNPFRATSIAPSLIGFRPVKAEPFEVASKSSIKPKRKIYKTAFRAAASVAVLLGLGLMLSTPVIEHSSEMASFGKSIAFQKAEPEKIIIENPRQILSFASPNPSDATGIFVPAEKNVPAKNIATDSSDDKYYLIVASLPTLKKAEEYIAANPETKLGVLSADGRYRVYVASGATYNEVHSILSIGDNSTKYPDAWVFRR